MKLIEKSSQGKKEYQLLYYSLYWFSLVMITTKALSRIFGAMNLMNPILRLQVKNLRMQKSMLGQDGGQVEMTCKARTFSFSNVKWSKGANVDLHVTHDFSTDPSRYELRIPYQKYHDALNCDVILGDIVVQAYNGYGYAGFAQLRISPAGKEYYNRPIDFKLSIAAKDCEPYYSEKFNRWTKGFGCYYYVDEKMKSQDQEFNAYDVYYDFSKFNNDTVIHYDILAGEDYRAEPLDKGPQ